MIKMTFFDRFGMGVFSETVSGQTKTFLCIEYSIRQVRTKPEPMEVKQLLRLHSHEWQPRATLRSGPHVPLVLFAQLPLSPIS